MRVISEALAKWQLERLEAFCQSLKSRSKNMQVHSRSLVWQHIELAEDSIDDAISALRYNKFNQASLCCQDGLVQAGFAELLIRYGQKIDSSLNKVFLLTNDKKRSANEEMVEYLSDSMTQIKLAIEYSNCKVSKRSQGILSQAMEFYGIALEAIKEESSEDPEKPLHCAQAGLLQVHLASEFISAENQISLPGWRGLSNPMLGSPLRRGPELIHVLVETKQLLRQMELKEVEDEKSTRLSDLKSDWEIAYHHYVSALNSLAAGGIAHAQALIKRSLQDCQTCHQEITTLQFADDSTEHSDESAISGQVRNEGLKETADVFLPAIVQVPSENKEEPPPERAPLADVMEILGEVSELLDYSDLRKKTSMSNKLRNISTKYRDAHLFFRDRKYSRAEKLAAEALFELDLVREQIKKLNKRTTGRHKKIGHSDDA